MSRWLVGSVPTWLLLIGLNVLVVGGALLIQMWIRRRFPALRRDEHNDVTAFTNGFVKLVYAFFIGFLVSSMWGQINTADDATHAEGTAAAQMAQDAALFDTPDRERVRHSLLAYEQAAIAEWSPSGITRSPEADAALAHVYTAYGQVQAKTEQQKTLLATSYSNLDKASQARTSRILTSQQDDGLPWPLWAVVFLTSAMVLGAVVIYGVEKPVLHYPMVTVVGVIVATNLFLILELAHPYVGAVSTSSDSLQEVVRVLSTP